MRLGKRLKRSKKQAWNTAGLLGKPQNVSPESIVGLVQADLVASLYAPLIEETANGILESYVGQLSEYEDALQSVENASAEVDVDGTVAIEDGETLKPPEKPVFHSRYAINELKETLEDVSNFFFDDSWRVGARAARFERLLEERYGVFLPFVKAHPELEVALRTIQLRYQQGYFSPFRQSSPPIPRSTSVIILFMMQRGGMRWEITLFAALFFLIGLQPWALIAIVCVVQGLFWQRKRTPIGGMKQKIPAVSSYYANMSEAQKQAVLCEPVGEKFSSETSVDADDYDAILLGGGIPSLYVAALLTRAGRRVLLLSDKEDASGCINFANVPPKLQQRLSTLPFDTENANLAKISKQQMILVPAMCTETDTQGGVRFAQVGSEADGYCFELLSIPGVGTERFDDSIPLPVTANAKNQLMEDAASYLGDGWPGADGGVGHSLIGSYFAATEQINEHASLYYLSKILPDTVNSLRSSNSYGECAIRYVQSLLNKSFPLNAHVRSLVAGLGFKAECLRPKQTSLAAHVTHLCAAVNGEGMHYPVGGPRAMALALSAVIAQGGGRIVTSVSFDDLIFDESKLSKSPVATPVEGKEDIPASPRCIGIRLKNKQEIKFSSERINGTHGKSTISPVVVDMKGFIHVFIHRLSNDIRNKYKVPRGLPACAESRPVFVLCLALEGTPADLNITGADYYRLPNAARAQDEFQAETGQVRLGDIGWSAEVASRDTGTSSSAKTISEDEKNSDDNPKKPLVETVNEATDTIAADRPAAVKDKRHAVVHYKKGESWLHIAFPSAKDPSFVSRHGAVTTCVITLEADDDFCQAYDTKPGLFVAKPATQDRTKLGRLMETVRADVLDIFPQLEGKILHAEMRGLISRGLSHTPERFAASGVRPETHYPGLFVGSSDITVGGSLAASLVAGWLTVNAIVGYSPIDLLFLGKNITQDINRFLPEPDLYEEQEDVAVPLPSEEFTTDAVNGE
jgi:hypothetical protein